MKRAAETREIILNNNVKKYIAGSNKTFSNDNIGKPDSRKIPRTQPSSPVRVQYEKLDSTTRPLKAAFQLIKRIFLKNTF